MGLGSLGFSHPRLGPRQLSRPPLAAWRACLSPSPAGRCGAGRHAQKSTPDHDFELFVIAHILLALSYIVHLKNLSNMCNIAMQYMFLGHGLTCSNNFELGITHLSEFSRNVGLLAIDNLLHKLG